MDDLIGDVLYKEIKKGNVEKVKELLNSFKNLNTLVNVHKSDKDFTEASERHENWIHYATFFGKLGVLKCLIEDGKININLQSQVTEYGKFYSVLHIAAKKGNKEIVEYVLSKGINKNLENFNGNKAAEFGTVEIKNLINNYVFKDKKEEKKEKEEKEEVVMLRTENLKLKKENLELSEKIELLEKSKVKPVSDTSTSNKTNNKECDDLKLKIKKLQEKLKSTLDFNERLQKCNQEKEKLKIQLEQNKIKLDKYRYKKRAIKDEFYNERKKILETKKEIETLKKENQSLKQRIEDECFMKFKISNKELKIVNEIGRGSFGTCFSAKWEGSGAGIDVVVKEYQLINETTGTEIFDEFRLISNLFHTCVCRVLGFTLPTKKMVRIVMEKMDGNLYDFYKKKKGKLSLYDKFLVMQKMTQSIHFLHFKGILHRDIKSFNFLVSNSGHTVKITDFGLSKILSANSSTFVQSEGRGTVRWMAPEIFDQKSKYSIYSDMYALGITFYELLYETIPYNDYDNDPSVIYAVKFKDIRPDLDFKKNMPILFKDVIKKLLLKDPKSRTTSNDLLLWFEKNEEFVKKNFSTFFI